ncbi:MAG: DegV family protein [Candidatus Promineifilaceae bacterium]|jgi:DegV family protein with EDD domain
MSKRKVAVVMDSTANLSPEVLAENYLQTIPLNLIWGGESYRDGIDITTDEFYKRLENSSELPTTSQPSVGDFHELYTRVAETTDSIVCVTLSSGISGTYASAVGAADLMEGFPIEVVDSLSASVGHGFIALAAARAAKAGAGLQEAAQAARELVPKMNVFFAVDTLEYLHRGGRIGGASWLIGSALSIKPVLQISDGLIDSMARVRTKKKALAYLADLAEERFKGHDNVHLAVVDAVSPDEAHLLGEELQKRLNPVEFMYGELSPVIGTHAGPGTVGFGGYYES